MANPGPGATLQECTSCGAVQQRLKWLDGHGWSCPVCEVNVLGQPVKYPPPRPPAQPPPGPKH